MKTLRHDLQRAASCIEGSKFHKIVELFKSPGVHGVISYRLWQMLQKKPFLVRLFLKPFVAIYRCHVRRWWGIDIGPEAQIGAGFMINHYGGIFIAGDVVAGEFFTVTHDITIGYSRAKTRQGFPTIGNNVYIAPGAKLAGRIKVGNNVSIGSNAVVEKDIPDNAVVQIHPMLVVSFPINPNDIPHW